jgi:hypothetical protein
MVNFNFSNCFKLLYFIFVDYFWYYPTKKMTKLTGSNWFMDNASLSKDQGICG